MAFGRTAYSFGVEGADTAERAFKSVAAAEDAAGVAAQRAAGRMVGLDQAAQLAGIHLDSTGRVMTGAAKASGALGKALDAAGSGFAILTRAAAILPGFGIAGLLLSIGEGAKYLYEQMSGVSEETKRASLEIEYQAALARDHADLLNKQADAARNLAAGMTEAGEAFIAARTGIASGAGGQGYLSAAVFGGEVGEISEAKRELRERAGALVKARADLLRDYDAATDYEGTLAGAAAKGALLSRRDALALEATEIRRIGDAIRDREVDLMREARRIGGDPREAQKRTGREVKGPAIWWRDRAGAMMDAADEERARKNREREFAGPGFAYPRNDGEALGAGSFGGFQPTQPGIDGLKQQADAMQMLRDSFNGSMDAMAMQATDASGIMVGAIGAITGALGQMATNAIIAGDAGGKGAAKMAGNALAGLSAQAFGYAVLLEGMALVSLLAPMIGLPAAGGLATAGLVMAGIGGTLAVTARALGADKLGGSKSSGARGGGMASATGTNPYSAPGQQATQVVVYIGEEQVVRGVRTENRREAQRGGMGGHFAMAAG